MSFSVSISHRERALVQNAFDRRESLAAITDAYRVVNGAGDRLPGWTLDRYGDRWQLQIFDPVLWPQRREWADLVGELFEPQALVLKRRTDPDGASLESAELEWWCGEGLGRTVVNEAGSRFAVDLGEGINPYLFLDMRRHRLELARHLSGRRLLNLFAYTGSFGVHAWREGASAVTQVDLSAKILQRAKLNLRLNGHRALRGELLRWDSIEYLAWAEKKEMRFDAIVIDPPTFSKNRGKTFRVVRDLPVMIERALRLLAPGGILLVGTNCSAISTTRLEGWIAEGAAARGGESRPLFCGGQDVDFPENCGARESHLAVVACELRLR